MRCFKRFRRASIHFPLCFPWKAGASSKAVENFRDGKSRIDAVLVFNSEKMSRERDNFIKNLKEMHLNIEFENSMYRESIVYIKVNASEDVLLKYAKKHSISIKMKQLTVLPEPEIAFDFMKTILNDPRPNSDDEISRRAWPTISKQQPQELTSTERSQIVFFIMDHIKYSDNEFDVGLSQLLHKKLFIAAYPLHDGPWQWPESDNDPLNDRQLLAEYWANFRMWNKQQPLTVIEKYFGYEIALYFAWLGFYNKMLMIASIMGILTFLYGCITVFAVGCFPIKEACQSSIYMCPNCKICKPKKLSHYCQYFKYAYINDNGASVIFSCAMAFWATIFMELWKREKAILMSRWNVDHQEDEVLRPDFIAKTKNMRLHIYTKEVELYIPMGQQLRSATFSVIGVTMMIVTVLLCILSIILYECALKKINFEKLYISFTSAIFTLIVMILLRKLYMKVAFNLTNQEIPRTQLDFDKSFMIKMVLFSIVNNYGKLMYIAFFKGKFYTYPGDPAIRLSNFPMSSEVCDPMGCVSEVFMLLATITILKPLIFNILELSLPIVKVWIRNAKGNTDDEQYLPTWEKDFNLNVMDRFSIMTEFEEMVMQYGFVTFFVAAFPLAPLFALFNNIFEIRIDSNKMVKYFRRLAVKKTTSITIWFDLLQAMAYIAVITNALFITFTSRFIPSLIYYFKFDESLEGYLNSTLSRYKITDNYWPNAHIDECYYVGDRYPPENENAYQPTSHHYFILSCRLGFAITFTLIVLTLTSLIAYAIPDIPRPVRELLSYNERKSREF